MKKKIIDLGKWIFLLPLSLLLAELTAGTTEKLVSFLENYTFGSNFINYYWYLFYVIIDGFIYGFFLSATSYLIAPKNKIRSVYVVLAIMILVYLLTNNDFTNEFFYAKLLSILIAGRIALGSFENSKNENYILKLFKYWGLFLFGVGIVASLGLHFWTVNLVYHEYGLFLSFCSLFLPVITETIYLFKLWNINDSYVKLFFLSLIFHLIRTLISKITK